MPLKFPIYLDYHATTPIDPRVLEVMMKYLTEEFGNAASKSHPYGWRAGKVVEEAREEIAKFIGAKAEEIIFTSGATESNNIAIKGAAEMYAEKGKHIITEVAEHKSVIDPCKYLEKKGFKVTYLPVDSHGKVQLNELEHAITDETILISIMAANNEIGTLQPIAEIGKIAKRKNVLFHVDAAQIMGKLPVNVDAWHADIVSVSAHKFYGPKGIGVLYVRSKNPHVRLAPVIHGGGHEKGLRSGTLNVPAIAGLAKACEIAEEEMETENERVRMLRDRLRIGLESAIDGIYLNGHPTDRLCNNLNISIAQVESESLIMAINEEICVSTGSACSSGSPETSHVLKALGLSGERVFNSIRFGVGRYNTIEEIDYTIKKIAATVERLRRDSPMSAVYRKGG